MQTKMSFTVTVIFIVKSDMENICHICLFVCFARAQLKKKKQIIIIITHFNC